MTVRWSHTRARSQCELFLPPTAFLRWMSRHFFRKNINTVDLALYRESRTFSTLLLLQQQVSIVYYKFYLHMFEESIYPLLPGF